jgi:hypothetical protein
MFAMCIITITNMIGVQVSVSYCIDSYGDLSGEVMIIIIIIRNTVGFAGLAEVHSFLIFIKQLRKASAHHYSRYVKEMAAVG